MSFNLQVKVSLRFGPRIRRKTFEGLSETEAGEDLYTETCTVARRDPESKKRTFSFLNRNTTDDKETPFIGSPLSEC